MKVCSRGGVGVYTNYRDNMIVDADHPILKWKANKKNERLRPSWFPVWVRSKFPDGFPYIASEQSEDTLSWNLFRSLQLAGKLRFLTDRLGIHSNVEKVYFWQHDADRRTEEIDSEIQGILNEMEPWGRNGRRQQTETDIILRGAHHIVMVESKLGKLDEVVKAWGRGGSPNRPMRSDYPKFMKKLGVKLFRDSFTFEQDGRRFYQLFRNYLLGAVLSNRWDTKFSLLAIVNGLNSNLKGRSHEEEFQTFQCLLEEPGNTFLMTWQQLWRILPDEPELSQLRQWLQGHPLLCLV